MFAPGAKLPNTQRSFGSQADLLYTPCVLAAKQATTDIPIVAAVMADPVGTGLVASLSRPGGNITGLSNMGPETAGKCVELFHDMIPSLRRVGVLANPIDHFLPPTGRYCGVQRAEKYLRLGQE